MDHLALCGWIDDGGHHAIAATFPRFAAVSPRLMFQPRLDDKPVLLYKAWSQLLGGLYPSYKAQEIGDCVSHGHAHANDLLQAIEIGLGQPAELEETDTEALYAMAREAGNMLGGQDGCYGAAAVKAMTEGGMVSRPMLAGDGAYSGTRAKSWGRTGAPEAVKKLASGFKLGSAARVSSYEELDAALQNGYPVTICTALGFTMTRDKNGFCRRSGKWGHCMFLAGIRYDIPGACVVQSWGPETPEGPLALDQPAFTFWVDKATIQAILAEGDSYVISKAPYFKGRKLPAHWSYGIAA